MCNVLHIPVSCNTLINEFTNMYDLCCMQIFLFHPICYLTHTIGLDVSVELKDWDCNPYPCISFMPQPVKLIVSILEPIPWVHVESAKALLQGDCPAVETVLFVVRKDVLVVSDKLLTAEAHIIDWNLVRADFRDNFLQKRKNKHE